MKTLFSLEGRIALVTGGSRGIGRMIAEGFLEYGAKVYISARKAEACDATAEELSVEGGARASRWRASLKWQRLEPYEKFAKMIERHWDGIAGSLPTRRISTASATAGASSRDSLPTLPFSIRRQSDHRIAASGAMIFRVAASGW